MLVKRYQILVELHHLLILSQMPHPDKRRYRYLGIGQKPVTEKMTYRDLARFLWCTLYSDLSVAHSGGST